MSFLTRVRHRALRRLLERRHAAADPRTRDWNWGAVRYNRIALVNLLVQATKGPETRYLEIGCAGNALFDAVPLRHKTGVDPARGGTVRATSGDYFATNRDTFDVIFIDGLHEYPQVRRDAINAAAVSMGRAMKCVRTMPKRRRGPAVRRLIVEARRYCS